MGHVTDKVGLIVLGGTWSDYPQDYQAWFVHELFRALNETGTATTSRAAPARRNAARLYRSHGIAQPRRRRRRTRGGRAAGGARRHADVQPRAVRQLYPKRHASWQAVAARQRAMLEEVAAQQAANEQARHRLRRPGGGNAPGRRHAGKPDAAAPLRLHQGADGHPEPGPRRPRPEQPHPPTWKACGMPSSCCACSASRTHVQCHGEPGAAATPERDKQDYRRLVTDAPYQPDEVKLYPCVLVEGTGLEARAPSAASWRPYDRGRRWWTCWRPTWLATPPYTRISRMIRDISAHDIVAGNRKTNLRQLVEERTSRPPARPSKKCATREIGADAAEAAGLTLSVVRYRTHRVRGMLPAVGDARRTA